MKESQILQSYEIAKERYAALGVDTDAAVAELEKQQISLHCWQTDDVIGFERNQALSGGIQTTGNYPGRARNIDEVRKDLEFVKTLLACWRPTCASKVERQAKRRSSGGRSLP